VPRQSRSEAAYIVLGLVEYLQPATPYDLKQVADRTTFNFWSVPHTRLYTECTRLAEAGLLNEQREQTGRRRKLYTITPEGQRELDEWRSEPATQEYELWDPATLKLFLGADPAVLAESQVATHRRRLEYYEQLMTLAEQAPRGYRLALEAGIGHQREFIRFWTTLQDGSES